MLTYIVNLLAVAVFPLVLAGYGGHLATLALPDSRDQRRAKLVVWGLALAGVLFSALQQAEAYRSDKEHDEKQAILQSKLDTSLQKQEYARGQLDSISVMIGKFGEKSSDPVLGQLAGAIVKMSQNARAASQSLTAPANVRLQVLYNGSELEGRTISVVANQPTSTPFQTSDFRIKNAGGRVAGPVSVRLYFSSPVVSLVPQWQSTASDDSNFATAFYSTGFPPILINPQETWNWISFNGVIPQGLSEPISAKVKVFYGAEKPVEVAFLIRKSEQH
jgi:hypothetical protein